MTLQSSSRGQVPLRVWPGVAAAALLLLFRLVLPIVAPEAVFFGLEATVVGLMGSAVAALSIIVWWMFFSRAPGAERLGALAVMVAAPVVTSRLVHESIAGGAMGMLLYIMAIPLMSLALVGWAVISRRLSRTARRVLLAVAILLASGVFTAVRTGGITSDVIGSELHWRWTPTPEERLLAQAGNDPLSAAPAPLNSRAAEPAAEISVAPLAPRDDGGAAAPAATPRVAGLEATASPIAETPAAWPGFRGSGRDGNVRGARIATEWSASPPVQIWRRPVGPGWSSFAVNGDLLYTQEQRGDDEIVACYRVSTGEPVWRHRDASRFWESNAGPGPRATPALAHGRVYALGATGILNALDAADGSPVWSRNAATDTGAAVPDWGIASSPVVVGDVVVAAAAGSLVAYDAETGRPLWFGPKGGWGYSSPHLVTIGGVTQVVLVNGPGVIGVDPSDGTVMWQHAWGGDSIVQPAVMAGGDLLIGSGSGLADHTGMLRLAIEREGAGWSAKERWMSTGLKPYFNDFVVHEGQAFGFDGTILASINLEDGNRRWKGGRYGHGQLVLLPDQDLLLVLSEGGELVLVSATPDKFTEIARHPALEGKTWNHPVLIGDILLVRNGEEMAAYRLPLAGS